MITFSFLAIGRNLIPRYFRSIFDGGAVDLSYTLAQSKESYQNNIVVLDCDKATMTTTYHKRLHTKVLGLFLSDICWSALPRVFNIPKGI